MVEKGSQTIHLEIDYTNIYQLLFMVKLGMVYGLVLPPSIRIPSGKQRNVIQTTHMAVGGWNPTDEKMTSVSGDGGSY